FAAFEARTGANVRCACRRPVMDAPNMVARCAVALLRAVPCAIVAAAITLTLPSLAFCAPTKPAPNKAASAEATGKIDTEKLFGAIVKLSAVAIPDARSA